MFEDLINETVKVLYRDGDQVRSMTGDLISSDSGFVKIVTFNNTFYIKIDTIIKIRKREVNHE